MSCLKDLPCSANSAASGTDFWVLRRLVDQGLLPSERGRTLARATALLVHRYGQGLPHHNTAELPHHNTVNIYSIYHIM